VLSGWLCTCTPSTFIHSMVVTTVAAILAGDRWENLLGKVAERHGPSEKEERNQLSKQEMLKVLGTGER